MLGIYMNAPEVHAGLYVRRCRHYPLSRVVTAVEYLKRGYVFIGLIARIFVFVG